MELSLSKLPWWAQIGAFVVVSVGSVFAFEYFYSSDIKVDIESRRTRLTAMRSDIARGVAAARQLPQFQAQVADLERRLESLRAVLPEQKDIAEILRRLQALAVQSNVKLDRFQPQPPKQQTLHAELPIKIVADGTYHNLGAFFDRISKFPRIINVGEISIKAKQSQEPNSTITAECTATTFILQEAPPPPAGRGRGAPPPAVKQ
jgi:type IV pilus assembly protein PilO